MDEKLYIQDLVNLLAEKQDIKVTEAEAFVKTIFELIKDALETDKIVKIKGLGTFKLTEVESRESINVNTGERFRIERHTKISFTPDTQMRDMINKPFSHFETVVLNEGVTFDDMPLSGEGEDNEEEVEEPLHSLEEPVIEKSDNKETLPDEIVEPDTQVNENQIAAYPVSQPTPVEHHHSTLFYGLSIAFIVILLGCGFVFFIPNLHLFEGKEKKQIVQDVPVKQKEYKVLQQDTVTIPVVARPVSSPIDTTKTIITGVRKGSNSVIADSTSYVIVGTMATYKLKVGETLTMVSKHFYETKDLWPYLVMHNRDIIKNPNRLSSGTVIRVPALRDKGYDR